MNNKNLSTIAVTTFAILATAYLILQLGRAWGRNEASQNITRAFDLHSTDTLYFEAGDYTWPNYEDELPAGRCFDSQGEAVLSKYYK